MTVLLHFYLGILAIWCIVFAYALARTNRRR